MQEKHTYPSRKHLEHSSRTRMAKNQRETPLVVRETLTKIAVFFNGTSSVHNNGSEITKIVEDCYLGHGTLKIPLSTKPITPTFATKRGQFGGGTSPEALRRAKRKARSKTNHNHNGNK